MRKFPLYAIVEGRCGCGNAACTHAGKHPNPYGQLQDGAGYGIETGGGLIVLDIDTKSVDGFASLDGFEVPDTYAVRTPTGGAHLYYTYDANTTSCQNRRGALPGIDIRADGGFVVGAGSPHVNGGVYQEVPLDFAPAPQWLLELARKTPRDEIDVPVPLAPEHPQYELNIRRCADELRAFPPAIEGQGGDTQLFLAAQIPVRKYQLPLDVAEKLLIDVYNPRCEPPWTDFKRFAHKVEQAAYHGSHVIGTHDWLQKLISREPPPAELKAKNPEHVYTYDPGTPASPQRVPLAASDVLNKLLADPVWSSVWRYDEFHKKLLAVDPPMKLDAETIGLTENDAFLVALWFEAQGFKVSAETAMKCCEAAARRNSFHPVRDYLRGLPEPSTNWLDDLAARVYGDDGPWAQRFLRNTLVGAVRRMLQPGCKWDYVPILYGPDQGEGKSKSIKALFGPDFSSEQFPDLSDMVRACMDVQGAWAVEAAELHAIRSHKDVEAVKAFISRQVDSFTPKYGRHQVSLPRSCIFIGTTNEDDFLRDKTGNRRFWPIRVTKSVDLEWLVEHRDEIWSEAYALAHTNYRTYMTRDEDTDIDDEVRQPFEQQDAWFQEVYDYCVRQYKAGKRFVTIAELYNKLETEVGRQDMKGILRVTGCLKQLKCKNRRVGKKRICMWELPDLSQAEEPEMPEAEKTMLAAKKLAN